MNADRIRLGHVRAGENGTSPPAYRPPLSRIAPPHRRGLDLPRPPSIYVRRICRRQIAEPRSVLPQQGAIAKPNVRRICRRQIAEPRSVLPQQGAIAKPPKKSQRKPIPIGEWRRIARLRAGRGVGVEISHKIQYVT